MAFELVAGSAVKILDHTAYEDFLRTYNIHIPGWDSINEFVYAPLPEGSHGKFLVRHSDLSNLNVGQYGTTLKMGLFEHKNLCVTYAGYVDVPITPWDTAQERLAIVDVVDLWPHLDSPITLDYNRITTQLPIDTANKFEPIEGELESTQTLIEDMLAKITTSPPSLSLSGFPTEALKNILSGSCSFKEYMLFLADSHFLVCYCDHNTAGPGRIKFSDTVQTSFPTQFNQVLFSSYGNDYMANKLVVNFSTKTHHYTKNRTTVLKPYYADIDNEWPRHEATPTAENSVLPENNRRTGNVSRGHYYAFHDPADFGTDGLAAFATKLATNYAKRTVHTINILFKDIITAVEPNASIQRIIYKYGPSGFTTQLQSIPPRHVSLPPETNHVGRGMEFVPPFVAGKVVNGPSGKGGYIPDSDPANVELPDIGNGTHVIPTYNRSTQRMFNDDEVGVLFDIHNRRYSFYDKCERLFRFELVTPFVEGVGTGIRKHVNGTSSGVTEEILDPLNLFSSMAPGDEGYMIYIYDDKFVAIGAFISPNATIEFTIISVTITSNPDFAGLKAATVEVRVGPSALVGETVTVYDHSGCIFDLPNEDLVGYTGWAFWGRAVSKDPTADPCELTPFHWAAMNRCCDPDTGNYEPCEEV